MRMKNHPRRLPKHLSIHGYVTTHLYELFDKKPRTTRIFMLFFKFTITPMLNLGQSRNTISSIYRWLDHHGCFQLISNTATLIINATHGSCDDASMIFVRVYFKYERKTIQRSMVCTRVQP